MRSRLSKTKTQQVCYQQNSPIKKLKEFLQIDEKFLDQKLGFTLRKEVCQRRNKGKNKYFYYSSFI